MVRKTGVFKITVPRPKVARCRFCGLFVTHTITRAMLTLSVMLSVGLPVYAEASFAEVTRWLNKMDQALMQAQYEGELVFRADERTRRIFVQQAWFDGVRHLRMRQQGEVKAEIIRRGSELICLHPEFEANGLRQVAGPNAEHFNQLADKLQVLRQYYKLERVAAQPVAGRQTVGIDMRAKDAYRFHHRLWLDEKTALVLKSTVRNAKNEVLEQFEFVSFDPQAQLTRMDFEPPEELKKWFDVKQDKEALAKDAQQTATVDAVRWTLEWVPPGFAASQKQVRKMRGKMRALESMMFSDGLAAFTVFVERRRPADSPTSVANAPVVLPNVRQGATLTHSRSVVSSGAPSDRHKVVATVVGDIPYETAKRILLNFEDAAKP